MKTPFKHLNLLVGGCHKRSKFWEEVVEKVRKRLSKWKCKFISMASRLYLIKLVLFALPLFFLSLYKIPVMVKKEIVRLYRNFLWGWGLKGRKIAWASWKKVCQSKESGGLGMIDIRRFNIALLGKWMRRLGYEKTGLWKEVIDSKYGGWRDLRSQRKSSYDSLWWRDLKEVWSLDEWKYKFEDTFSWEVGNGREVRLWEDKWVGNTNLKDAFLRLYTIYSSIWHAGDRSKNLEWNWNIEWRRNFLKWKQN